MEINFLSKFREFGVSFIVRCRNESFQLKKCLDSLKGVTIPHEIILVLHLCDEHTTSVAIAAAKENPNIALYRYDLKVSRAGYETLITPADHPHSFMTFTNFGYGKSKYLWKFNFDVDFELSDALKEKINSFDYTDAQFKEIQISLNYGDGTVSGDKYLSNSCMRFVKNFFWEVKFYMQGDIEQWDSQYYLVTTPPGLLKPYWLEEPWFLGVDSDLEEKYDFLVDEIGPEPHGLARWGNPLSDEYQRKIWAIEDKLKEKGINIQE